MNRRQLRTSGNSFLSDFDWNREKETMDIMGESTTEAIRAVLDVLNDVTDMETDSDDYEGREADETELRIRRKLCRARAIPRRGHPLRVLYRNHEYRRKCVRKVTLMKSKLKFINLRRIYGGRRFRRELRELNRLYGKSADSGRYTLNALVAIFHTVNWNH